MIHLTTGGPGTGKTLFTLHWVYGLSRKTGRPVCYNSHLKLAGAALDWGWQQITMSDWEAQPDGTIFLVDEAQLVFRKRGTMSSPPGWIENLTVHRHRGFDFFLVTQDPKNIDLYLRGLIASPGWHRHLKRKWGSPLVAVLEWETFYPDAGDLTSGASANSVQHLRYPQEHYGHYVSATEHTVQFKVPRAFWIVAVAACVAVALFLFASSRLAALRGGTDADAEVATAATTASHAAAGVITGSPSSPAAPAPDSLAAYAAARVPRVPDLAYTAPVYDDVTRPVRAPYPIGCMSIGDRCECYSQQATRLAVSRATCLAIIKDGIFLDWDTAERRADSSDGRSPGRAGEGVTDTGTAAQARPWAGQ